MLVVSLVWVVASLEQCCENHAMVIACRSLLLVTVLLLQLRVLTPPRRCWHDQVMQTQSDVGQMQTPVAVSSSIMTAATAAHLVLWLMA